MPSAIDSISKPFFKKERFYILLPLEDQEKQFSEEVHQSEADILRLLMGGGIEKAAGDCVMLEPLPTPKRLREAALLSHFCFRVIVWNNDDITPPEVRKNLAAVKPPNVVAELAELLLKELKALYADAADGDKDAVLAKSYMKPTPYLDSDPENEYHETLKKLILSYVVANPTDPLEPGFLDDPKSYEEYEELAEKVHIRPDGKRDTQFSEQRITWHLQALLHDWFLKVPTELDWNTVNRSQKDLDTMDAWYRLWANFYDWLWYNDWEKTQNIQKSK